ncbi:TY-Chap domain-containing protein [Dietzia sp. UBA5065]|uniref:TY-Chap domain-containing protein n=1 Tax=Dietzia sp. UBA5065 TaxID=1946422 RepID=UPI0025C4913F|nr:hypothetical protein [Dietzia sp. UBA5065]
MPDFEFDVDASIAAGWERFAARLADLLRDLVPGATFDLAVPVLGAPSTRAPYIRFTAAGDERIHLEVSGGGSEDLPVPLRRGQLEQLTSLGWADGSPEAIPGSAPSPSVTLPVSRASEAAHLVAGTMERVFGIPHPVFLHDVAGPDHTDHGEAARPVQQDADFQPLPITDPDEATRAVGAALAEVYQRRVQADEHDVFTVPAGCVVLFVRAHRSLPLIVFRSPLVSSVEDVSAAETEVAILNRDSLWCRYVFDGKTISAESEFVDRVFVPVNFKIQLAEISAELDDIYSDLARRVAGKRWRDLRAAEEDHTDGQ